ncbi:malectin domain-containing carbohydrate-binding protein [Chitinophagaceae bacterium LB-8]|uniref:Malectin domain-containing carbohydrate-binding protein n=1 Tax=Paraflavisolibacter caeni TaxID=2982496 RepID=A0A9X3BIL6_9BACT|nr:malectin domain-containing carbohydrate-binding protein [Paraflavisolibacter caeni]MCU7551587.1 malectin domain-containing carbohydrate-binding protein [Paraflavisolibacter caeni]
MKYKMLTFTRMQMQQRLWMVLFTWMISSVCMAQLGIRKDVLLNNGWRTIANDTNQNAYAGFEKNSFTDRDWKQVKVPHNWDAYEGYRRMKHGNRHGYAWYRKTFTAKKSDKSKRYFLFFEGVGSYATIWLNGKKVGNHKGGRTSFTLDVTNALQNGNNILAVKADHPAMINDLPWLCGGCSEDRGWSEGSQPLGIFRPVHLVETNNVRVEPFGVHIWNDRNISAQFAKLFFETEVKNYGKEKLSMQVVNRFTNHEGKTVFEAKTETAIASGSIGIIKQESPQITNPHLWSTEDPYLYTMTTEVSINGKVMDSLTTPYGIRWIEWPIGKKGTSNQFLLNGKPVFINGTCEYEHNMGKSHAFEHEQIKARVMQIKAAGYNAFRDAHQPHNLLYQEYWDQMGILWWPQFSAHAWYDTPEFKANFKELLKDWVKERRNSPSIILWGLQNESKIPEDFAKECTEMIRALDPTASEQRLVTTCNGGEGTDWNVPQNWTGTYGGNPATYSDDLKRQILVGEYGAWRSLDLHTSGPFDQNGIYSEDRMTQLMEMKVELAESVKDSVAGHFHWLFNTHDNPGRVQGGEAYRELDRIGPVNYKGLFTAWGEPTDAYYMFRANYTPKDKEPMVYIVSHTWPDRWATPGRKDSIIVYSNCDEVELFNDVKSVSLGKRTRNGVGTHFQWDNADIQYNVLYAEGRVAGKVVSRDTIILNHIPRSPHFNDLLKDAKPITAATPGCHYLYRVNCGGPDYIDKNGNLWMADKKRSGTQTWGSLSWTNDFAGLPSFFASQRWSKDPVKGTADWPLFQNFRYGLDRLRYEFPVPAGEYLVELYFSEPWYGTGGGLDCKGWRLFDVAVNGKTVIKDLDIWKEVGHDAALKKTVKVKVTGGLLRIDFPKIASGQAIISAIAISSQNRNTKPAPSVSLIKDFKALSNNAKEWRTKSWLNTGDTVFVDEANAFSALPPILYGAEWIQTSNKAKSATGKNLARFTVDETSDVYIALNERMTNRPAWLKDYADAKKSIETNVPGGSKLNLYARRFAKGDVIDLGTVDAATIYSVFVVPATTIEPAYDLKPTNRYEAETAGLMGAEIAPEPHLNKKYVAVGKGKDQSVEWQINVGVADMYALRFRYINQTGNAVPMQMKLFSADGTLMYQDKLQFTPTSEKWATYDSSTGTTINAGNYKVVLSSLESNQIGVDYLEVQ